MLVTWDATIPLMGNKAAPTVREILYVDVQRVRSLLSQIDGGLLDLVQRETSNNARGEVEAKVFGVGGGAGYDRSWSSQESRSMQDLVFGLFEEQASLGGWITDLGSEASNRAEWESGSLHGRVKPSQLVRITAPLQLFDATLFRSRLDKFQTIVKALVLLQVGPAVTSSGKPQQSRSVLKEYQQKLDAAAVDLAGGASPEILEAITSMMESILGENIAMRVLACGGEHRQFSFSGPLLARDEYIQNERDELISRYGSAPTEWTCVLQIGEVPSRSRLNKNPEDLNTDILDATGSISRAGLERMGSELLSLFEGIGISDGPQWPTISVTPLGIYRTVPHEGG